VPDIVFESVTFRYKESESSQAAGEKLDAAGVSAAGGNLDAGSDSSAGFVGATSLADSTDVLSNVSVSVERGEFVAVIGANGSGKSTFARHINALLKPRGGRVLTVGLDTRDPVNLFNIRSHAGMVFQDPNTQMVAGIVADDVAFGPENLNVAPPELYQRVDQSLAAVGMYTHKESDPARLSGGQRQRVAIAGILAMHPDILVLDEPGAMLDVRGRQSILGIVEELNAGGMTVIWITHTMEVAAKAERVIVFSAGKIALDGTPTEVFSQHQTIKALGLDLPFSIQLANALVDRGLSLAVTLSPEELTEQICAWYSSR